MSTNRDPSTRSDGARPPAAPPAAEPRARLPRGYGGLRALQGEFRRYQAAAFPPRPSRFFALELAGETGELANLEKKAWKGRPVDDADFRDEAADVCIALLNFANSRGIDLAAAVEKKMRRIDDRQRTDPEVPVQPRRSSPEEGS